MTVFARSLAAVIFFSMLSVACSGSEQPISRVESPTAIAGSLPTPGPPLPPIPGIPQRVPSTVLLVDALSGSTKTLYESLVDPAYHAGFEGEVVFTYERRGPTTETARYNLHGVEVGRSARTLDGPCLEAPSGATVEGQTYPGVYCGPISPDKRWMTYQVPAGEETLPAGHRVPVWDQWAVDLNTDARVLLQDHLLHCGGCDGRFGPAWSPSGRYLFFSELVSGGRIFLSDPARATTRVIAAGTDLQHQPDWSPNADRLVYRSERGNTVLEDLDAGTMVELTEVPWPARFDSSGSYLYSPAWGDTRQTAPTTTLYDVERRMAIASLPGQTPPAGSFLDFRPVSSLGGQPYVALEGAPACSGTAVYERTVLRHCLAGAVSATFSPDGSRLAAWRKTGEIGPFESPTVSSISADVFEVIILDVSSGAINPVGGGLIGAEYPPPVTWNSTGTYIVVISPFAYGP